MHSFDALGDEGTQLEEDDTFGTLESSNQQHNQHLEALPLTQSAVANLAPTNALMGAPASVYTTNERSLAAEFPTFAENRISRRASSSNSAPTMIMFEGVNVPYSEQVALEYKQKTSKEVKNVIEIRLEDFVSAYTLQLKVDLILSMASDARSKNIFFEPFCVGLVRNILRRKLMSSRVLGNDLEARIVMLNNLDRSGETAPRGHPRYLYPRQGRRTGVCTGSYGCDL